MSKGLKLSEILVTALIAVIFATICSLWWLPYNLAQIADIHLEQLTYGIWSMAAIVAYSIIPKPGIALAVEFAAGADEAIVIGRFDIPTIVYVILQGLACKVVFAIFKYESCFLTIAMLAGLITALVSFPVDCFCGYLNEVTGWSLSLFIIFRAISGIVLSGILSYLIVKALNQTGVTKLFRPASQRDYDSL